MKLVTAQYQSGKLMKRIKGSILQEKWVIDSKKAGCTIGIWDMVQQQISSLLFDCKKGFWSCAPVV